VRAADGRTPLDLARAFRVPETSMTHTLAGLEAAGLVETRPNPRDGRSMRVFLAPAGRAFRADAIAALTPDPARLAAGIDLRRVAAVRHEPEGIRRVMDRQRDETPGDGPAGRA
jgi:DNA-binding MarR family transcriptional regulator